ncbi:MAG: class I SAM-dependent methyltransferase [Anaerolineae bacterium]|nr:class I SAM-dependent methyltransferase [Anaerolineae bacterium]
MPETIKNCPLCGHHSSSKFDQREFRAHEVANQICDHCGLVFQSPRMSSAELDEFYTAQYRQVYQGEAGPTPKDVFVQNGRADALLNFIADAVPGVEHYLDIGCSTGLLLTRFQERYSCLVVGIEPGDAYRKYANAQGLEVYPDLNAMKNAIKIDFDLISLAHVLEHLPDPIAYLVSLRKEILLPQGRLLIEVPNLYAHDSFELAHMTSFSAHTLRQILQKSGYEIVASQEHGQPRSEILPLYLTVLAVPQKEHDLNYVVQPEINVSRNRKKGMLVRRLIQKISPHKAWVPLPKDEN